MSRAKYPTPGTLPAPTKPFASINLNKTPKGIVVSVQVLVDRLVDETGKEIEGAAFGLAIDGSRSMTDLYGNQTGPFGGTKSNQVEPVAKGMLRFLSNYSGDGSVEFIYWAVGPGGREIEDVGAVSATQIDSLLIKPRKQLGGQTHLMPVLQHFVENKFKTKNWSMGIIITDGMIDDMDAVRAFTESYAVRVHKGQQKLTKLVLIGLGEHVNAGQLEELDNFEASVDIDIWSAKLAHEMEALSEIFDEVMSSNLILAPTGSISDDQGNVLATFNDGLPAKFEFTLKPKSQGFQLEIPGQKTVVQDLSQGIALI